MLNDGKTIDDLRIVDSKWVEFVNKNVDCGDMTPGEFQFGDSFPSLESWVVYLTANASIPEGIAIDAEVREAADYTKSQLHKAEEAIAYSFLHILAATILGPALCA